MNSEFPIKLLSFIMENKNDTISNIKKTNNNTIEVTNLKNEKQVLSDNSLIVINKIEILSETKKIIRVFIESYFFDIDYSLDTVIITKKHMDCLNYPDILNLCELLLSNNVVNIKIDENIVIINTDSKNEIKYVFKNPKLKLFKTKIRKNDI